MWPELLDMTREECKRILRRVELEAYSTVVSAFRAQGDLVKEKKKILHDLQQMLSISTERHRAEVRRAVNDEKLATIADNISPNSATQEWMIEGRRLVPLMPRLVPQTAFTVTANQAANLQAEKNAAMPSPSQTGMRELANTSVSSTPSTSGGANRSSRPSSPTSNVVVLPSGMSIHIKDEDEDVQLKKRRRSASTDSLVSPTGTPTPQVTYTTTMSSIPNVSPMKITISKSPQSTPRVISSGSQTQKVILVSSAGQMSTPSVVQKSITVPLVRTTTSTGTSTQIVNKSIIFPASTSASINNSANVVTMASISSATTATTTSVGSPLSSLGASASGFITPTISISRPRLKTIPRQKILQIPQQKPGVVIPMGPQPVQPSPQTIQGLQLKPVSKQSPTIQIRQEGGMKIITQSISGGASKILPKPSHISGQSGTPIVVVSSGSSSSTTSSVTMLTRPTLTSTGQLGRTFSHAGTKVLNIQTQGGKILSATKGSSVVTVNPKTLHLTAVKAASGLSGTKPNVIVVQKTQPRRAHTPTTPPTAGGKPTTTILSSPFEKELVSFLQKQDPTKQYVVTTTTANLSRPVERKVIVTTSAHLEAAKQAAAIHSEGPKTSSQGEVTLNLEEPSTSAMSTAQTVSQPKVLTSSALPNNEWFEYDVTDEHGNTFTHTAESADTAAAIQSLLDMQANGSQPKTKVTIQRSPNIDLGQLSDQLNQQQFYTIEQAMTILNQQDKDTSSRGPIVTVPNSFIQTSAQQSQVRTTSVHSDQDLLSSAGQSTLLSTSGSVPTSDPQVVMDSSSVTQQEVIQGELDPQTGLFYVDKSSAGNKTENQGKVVDIQTVPSQPSRPSNNSKSFDLLSSSLAQAQIDLDPFQFIEDVQNFQKSGTGSVTLESAENSSEANVSVLSQPVDGALPSQNSAAMLEVALEPSGSGADVDSQESNFTLPVESTADGAANQESVVIQKMVTMPSGGGAGGVATTGVGAAPTVRIHSSSFIPLQEVGKTGKTNTINITTHRAPPASVVTVVPPVVSEGAVPRPDTSIHVTVEPSGLDTSHMKIEDFTSQQVTDRSEYTGIDHMEEIVAADSPPTGNSSLSDSQGEGSQLFDIQFSSAKRKRRPTSSDESPPPGLVSGWIRAAQGVLTRVSRYRGVNRDKNELNAAAWFTQPVDPSDAPDYYSIVTNPMDFGSIKRKLEGMKYIDFDEFHRDMCLVRDNCCLYNPAGSIVRKDCDEVFTYYQQEYEKLMEKWQKTHIASPISKKQKMDKSPIR